MNRSNITSREVLFASRPEGAPTLDTFTIGVVEVPPPPGLSSSLRGVGRPRKAGNQW